MTDRIEIKRDKAGRVLSPCCGGRIDFAAEMLRGAECLKCGEVVDAQAMLNQLAADVADLGRLKAARELLQGALWSYFRTAKSGEDHLIAGPVYEILARWETDAAS